MALVILTGVILSIGAASSRYLSAITRNRIRIQAAAVADARIAALRVAPDYATLTATFAGTLADVPLPGFSRLTQVVRTGAGTTADQTRVMVCTIPAESP